MLLDKFTADLQNYTELSERTLLISNCVTHIHFLILVLLKGNKSLQSLNKYKNLCIERRLVKLNTSLKVLRQIIPLHLYMSTLRDS